MNVVNILLLGVDSLIACLAIGPIVAAKWRVPLAALFGVADGAGFLVGTALGWQLPEAVTGALRSGVLLLFGVYLIAVTMMTSHAAARWPIWVLPFALTLDNLTYGLVGDDDAVMASPLAQAGSQALTSAVLGMVGLLVAVVLPRLFPQLEQRRTSNTIAGGALVVAAGLVLLT
jgi:hypothetical protein